MCLSWLARTYRKWVCGWYKRVYWALDRLAPGRPIPLLDNWQLFSLIHWHILELSTEFVLWTKLTKFILFFFKLFIFIFFFQKNHIKRTYFFRKLFYIFIQFFFLLIRFQFITVTEMKLESFTKQFAKKNRLFSIY